jgi:hypothetical protein
VQGNVAFAGVVEDDPRDLYRLHPTQKGFSRSASVRRVAPF